MYYCRGVKGDREGLIFYFIVVLGGLGGLGAPYATLNEKLGENMTQM